MGEVQLRGLGKRSIDRVFLCKRSSGGRDSLEQKKLFGEARDSAARRQEAATRQSAVKGGGGRSGSSGDHGGGRGGRGGNGGSGLRGERGGGSSVAVFGSTKNGGCVSANPEALEQVRTADVLVFGPGSLFTSLVASVLPDGMKEAIAESSATKIFVANITTQPGQTDGMTLRGHVEALEQYIGDGALDFVIAHQAPGGAGGAGPGGAGGEGYVGELLCACDDDRRAWSVRPTLIEANLVGVVGLEWSKDPMLRHDSRKVANAIKQLIRRVAATGDGSNGSQGSSGGGGGKGSGFGGFGGARGGAGESASTPRGRMGKTPRQGQERVSAWEGGGGSTEGSGMVNGRGSGEGGEEARWFGSVSPRRGRVALFSLVACTITAGFAVLGSKFAPRETNPD